MSLTQQQIIAINSINKEFQNYQIGTLLGQVLNGTYPDDAIGTDEIADLAVTTAKLAANSVTNDKLGSDVKAGSLAALTTSAKTSLQAAINELVTSIAAKLAITSNVSFMDAFTVQLNGQAYTPIVFSGSDLAAMVTGTNTETFNLVSVGDGGTIIMNPDGNGNETATINFAAGTSVSGASPSTDISAGVDNKFTIQVRSDTAEEVTLDLAAAGGLDSGAKIATEMQTKIQALGGNKASVTVDYNSTVAGKYAIVDSVLGTSSTVVITRSAGNNVTEELKIGTADGGTETAGTGDVANAAAVTAAEIATVMSADMTGLTASDSSGAVLAVSDTTGRTSSIVVGAGTLNTVLGFTNAAEYYGAQSLGMSGDMANATYRIIPVIYGVAAASLGALDLGISNKATSGFRIECETTSSEAVVDLSVFGELA